MQQKLAQFLLKEKLKKLGKSKRITRKKERDGIVTSRYGSYAVFGAGSIVDIVS